MSADFVKNQLAVMARTADKLYGIVDSFARSTSSPEKGALVDAMQASLHTTRRLANLARTAVNSA